MQFLNRDKCKSDFVEIAKEVDEKLGLLCDTTLPSKNFTTEEILEPIPTTTATSTTQTIDKKQSTKTDISEPYGTSLMTLESSEIIRVTKTTTGKSVQTRTMYKMIISIVLLSNEWNM
ncbi:hypothetical protein D915_010381 [Fasciola hepatica]|uniref:Uncharacterized protein n=1 Tax=Fasciola hepatica TaxID=6192 RepID=A0A4E0RBW7_FASHE|nr:hypothetical protein D915_010381 [Fasciola hepatica]